MLAVLSRYVAGGHAVEMKEQDRPLGELRCFTFSVYDPPGSTHRAPENRFLEPEPVVPSWKQSTFDPPYPRTRAPGR